MDSTTLWQLFLQTGRPEAYTLYRRVRQEQDPRTARRRKPGKDQLR